MAHYADYYVDRQTANRMTDNDFYSLRKKRQDWMYSLSDAELIMYAGMALENNAVNERFSEIAQKIIEKNSENELTEKQRKCFYGLLGLTR